jgi:hypothetical protein
MADSISVAYVAQLTVTETLGATDDLLFASAANRRVIHDQFNQSATMNATSTPAVTKVVSFVQALTDGSATLDLNVLTGTHGVTIDGAGLKIHAILAQADEDNEGVISFGEGAAAGYKLAGVAGWLMTLTPGATFLWRNSADTGDDIATGVTDTIDFAGTGTDSMYLTLVLG